MAMKNKTNKIIIQLVVISWCLTVFVLAPQALAQTTVKPVWRVPAATLRFEFDINTRPSEPGAGIIAMIPDGGILPRPHAKARVFTPSGRELRSEGFWHNRSEAMGIIFETPSKNSVIVYISPSSIQTVVPPRRITVAKLSLLQFVRNGNASLKQSRNMADNPIGRDILVSPVDMVFQQGVPVGREANASSYFFGWFKTSKPGRTYFYTVSQEGSEFYINNRLGYRWPGMHNRSEGAAYEKGSWMQISAAPQKLEYYQFNISRAREVNFGLQLPNSPEVYQPKHLTTGVFKGKMSLKYTSHMKPECFLRSGSTVLRSAQAKKSIPAIFTPRWTSYMHTGGMIPPTHLRFYEFEAFGATNHPNALYQWNFGGNFKFKGPRAFWLYTNNANQSVSLSVIYRGKTSTCSRVFFPKHIPAFATVNNPTDCASYREAFTVMCRSAPSHKRPCQEWNMMLWNGLLAVLDQHGQQEKDLLLDIFENSRADVTNLNSGARWSLEDKFYELLCNEEKTLTLTWLDRMEKEETNALRVAYWKAARVDYYIYTEKDLDKAEDAANAYIRASRGKIYQTILAGTRMADVARLNENYDVARTYYSAAQRVCQKYVGTNIYKLFAHLSPMAIGSRRPAIKVRVKKRTYVPTKTLGMLTLTMPTITSTKIKGGPKRLGKILTSTRITPNKRSIRSIILAEDIANWKVFAVHEAVFFATVQNLLRQKALYHAKNTLNQWEMEFPLSKLAGDFPLAEAKYYMATANYNRALIILESYRNSVDLSNELPEAMKLELMCLIKLGRDEDARLLAKVIIKRLPLHPVSEEAKKILESEGKLEMDIDIASGKTTWSAAAIQGSFNFYNDLVESALDETDKPQATKGAAKPVPRKTAGRKKR